MKKIPCLFKREFAPRPNGKGTAAILLPEVTPGLEWVLDGYGVATRKWDGTACLVQDGKLFKRYDAKQGKPAPANGIPCDDPDPKTGHWPHWILVGEEPESKWHRLAWTRQQPEMGDGTYELCGPHFNGNPELFDIDAFVPHGQYEIEVERSFEGLKGFLEHTRMEGIVFWRYAQPFCKIRKTDFGFAWGNKRK